MGQVVSKVIILAGILQSIIVMLLCFPALLQLCYDAGLKWLPISIITTIIVALIWFVLIIPLRGNR